MTRDVPPRLAGQVDRRDGLLPSAQHASAAAQWLAWWRHILAHLAQESVARRSVGDHKHERLHSAATRRGDFFDPPGFAALAGTPELRLAVTATYYDGVSWFGRWQPEPPPAGVTYGMKPPSEDVTPAGFRLAVIRDAAKSVASERRAPSGDLRAVAHVIDVEGYWSYLIAPGCRICSTDVAASPDAAGRFLRQVFGSLAL
jgi:hypothetical protein